LPVQTINTSGTLFYCILHPKLETVDKSYLQGKIAKDKTDLLSLMDPRYGLQNPATIFEIVKEFDLEFVVDTISGLPIEQEAIQDYRTTKTEVETWVAKILEEF